MRDTYDAMLKKLKEIYKNRRFLKEYSNTVAMLDDEHFCFENNPPPLNVKSVLFVIPEILPYYGGHTSILRLGTALAESGFEVAYVTYSNQCYKDWQTNSRINLSNCKGSFFQKNDKLPHKYDVVVATAWKSVFYARKYDGYKMYFVQDYEPYFFARGDNYFLAKRTYELGLHMVCLGPWNKNEILKNTTYKNLKIDVIDFPFEPNEYTRVIRDYNRYKDTKKLTIAAYIKQEDKRMPILTQMLLSYVKKRFQEYGTDVELLYFGMKSNVPVCDGKNLGKLSKQELNKLYQKADFGFVASMTNISLVPYEMIATGLPIIEMADGSFPDFFGEDCAIMCNLDSENLFELLSDYCSHPDKLALMQQKAENYINQFSWGRTCDQFVNIIKSLPTLE